MLLLRFIVVAAKKSEESSLFEVTLKFWKNGFSVNDGPLRSYDDPKSQEILHHIKHGYLNLIYFNKLFRDLSKFDSGKQFGLYNFF